MISYSILLLILLGCILLQRKFRRYVPILMYHRIAAVPGDRNALPPEKFAAQLAYLAKNGFTTITPNMLHAAYAHGAKLPPKPVLLTFDDGYADNYSAALPLLQRYAMTAVVFPIANWIGRENKWEDFHKAPTRTMTWQELADWQTAGMQIEGHTLDHPFLTNCPPERLESELVKSRTLLEAQLPTKINFLCYPYGFFDEKTVLAAKAAGYLGAFAIFDHVNLWQPDLYALPRIPIPAHQSMWEFRLKVSSIHLIFVALRKWERDFKRFWRKNN